MKKVNKGGRPSKYKQSFCNSLIEFFSKPTNERWLKKETIKSNGTIDREWAIMPAKMPFFEDWAWQNKISISIMDEWAHGRVVDGQRMPSKHPEFSEAYKRAKILQQKFLVDNGLAGFSPPAAYIFTAKNITNMRDKQEVDHTTGGEPMKFFELSFNDQAPEVDTNAAKIPARTK